MKTGDRVIEVGCGLATITAILAEHTDAVRNEKFIGYRCYDVSPDMVEYARQNLPEGYPVELGDARMPTHRLPDIVHSHGLLEHFSDADIRKIIDAERRDGARSAIHYVPSHKYKTPSFGDERLMTAQQWEAICRPKYIVEFNDGYDYCLVWDFS